MACIKIKIYVGGAKQSETTIPLPNESVAAQDRPATPPARSSLADYLSSHPRASTRCILTPVAPASAGQAPPSPQELEPREPGEFSYDAYKDMFRPQPPRRPCFECNVRERTEFLCLECYKRCFRNYEDHYFESTGVKKPFNENDVFDMVAPYFSEELERRYGHLLDSASTQTE